MRRMTYRSPWRRPTRYGSNALEVFEYGCEAALPHHHRLPSPPPILTAEEVQVWQKPNRRLLP